MTGEADNAHDDDDDAAGQRASREPQNLARVIHSIICSTTISLTDIP